MFAVPGWSVSTDTLKTQVEPKSLKLNRGSEPAKVETKKRKRKRGHALSKGIEVTEENLGKLWRKHIEGIGIENLDDGGKRIQERERKRRKRAQGRTEESALEETLGAHGATIEGFPKKDSTEGIGSFDTPAKKNRITPNGENQELNRAAHRDKYVQDTNGHHEPIRGTESLDDGKRKYERRRVEAAKTREQKALLQATGSLPPNRPDQVVNVDTKVSRKSTQPRSLPESSKSNNCPQEPALSKTKNLPNSTRDPKMIKVPSMVDPSSSTKLTPLQQRMVAKLISSRFRHLNELLYTSPSDKAMRVFADSPQNYTSYHAGFRAQVAVWPQNPVESFIEDVKTRGKVLISSQKKMWRDQRKGKKPKGTSNGSTNTVGDAMGTVDPLPRTKGVCSINDLGCGDAHLAASLHPLRTSLNLNIRSFDLAKGDTPNAHLITIADTSNLLSAGIQDSSVDIAICCLSLMGTNWVSVVDECARIVRAGGEVWVAEIKSRFVRPGRGSKKMKKDNGTEKLTKMERAEREEEAGEGHLISEDIEEVQGPKDETDVSAFVEVFGKRGFVLKGEPDMANKMFVRIRFVKELRPENEKGGAARFGDGFRGKQGKVKMVEDGEREVDENRVLKPCVYKIR